MGAKVGPGCLGNSGDRPGFHGFRIFLGFRKIFALVLTYGPGRTHEKLHLEPVVVGLTRSTGGLAALAPCFGGEPPILRE